MNGSHHSLKLEGAPDADRVSGLLDLLQSGCYEQLCKMAFANACEVGLVDDIGVELARCIPEHADGPRPPAKSQTDAATTPRFRVTRTDTADSHGGVLHEMDDLLRQCRIELRVLERQLLCGCSPHVDARMTLLYRGDEGLRWIDCRYRWRTESFDQLGCQCARANIRRRALVVLRRPLRDRPAEAQAIASTCP